MKQKIANINKFPLFISINIMIILFIMLFSFYPGFVTYDGNNQWMQVQSRVITNAHPFLSTYFMVLLSKIWNNVTIVFIYQIILISISWGYFCKIINIEGKKKKILALVYTVIVFLLPLTSLYTITLWKDILYTNYLFICAALLYEWANNNYRLSTNKYILLGIIITMVFNYRHNGVIVVILVLLVFYILTLKNFRKRIINKKNLKKSILVLLTFLILVSLISIPKKRYLDKSDKILKNQNSNVDNYSTIDGYMLWMMGSHIKNENITDKNDKKFLNNIIPLEEWKQAYNPYLINYTSNSEFLNKKYLINNSKKFEKMFIKYSFKNPGTIIKHYLNADALLIDPLASFHGYVYVFCFPEMWSLPEYTVIKPKFTTINKYYGKLIDISLKEPFIYFYEPAIILYLSLIITIILSKRVYGKKIWLFSLPMILNTVSLLPINLAQDLRYVYINYLTFYGLLLMLLLNWKKCFKKN